MDRRSFLLSPAIGGCCWGLLGAWRLPLLAQTAKAGEENSKVRIERSQYTLEWSPKDDRFSLRDKQGRMMTSGNMQPAIVVTSGSGSQASFCVPGSVASYKVADHTLTIMYDGVNRAGRLTVTWRCDQNGSWLDPFIYETTVAEDIVALHYFASSKEGKAEPSLENSHLVLPGISESSAISPIVPPWMNLNFRVWLGHGTTSTGMNQQWGLPSGYFCGFHMNAPNMKGAMKEGLSAFCCGAANLPAGDLMFETRGGKHGQVVNYRGDLWQHMHGPGRFVLGCTWRWSIGSNFYEAIRNYYLDLVAAGIIRKKVNSAHKSSVLLRPQFNTWGAEVASGKEWGQFDEPLLVSIYEGFKASGMKAGTFVIDAKWEGKYGFLEHSAERFPHFQEILARIRSDGHRLGMWAAFMRCEDPRDVGLAPAHMLHRPNGEPIVVQEGPTTAYYLFDFTQPEVQEVLQRKAKEFIKRYRPDLVKFDFGYELPSLDAGAPKDMRWAGEKLLAKGLDVVVNAMREENPDLVVMYYSLSPLFNSYFDLHSPDDLVMCAGEYDLEANRRFFFSGLLGEIGMPTYGSGGYDWPTMPQIWFDSAAVGTLGSLNSFSGDEENERATPARVAKYNGLAQALRASNTFSIRPIGADYVSPTRGAHTPSWARLENGEVVLLALRHGSVPEDAKASGFADIAQITASVVVASQTEEGIPRASRLAVVPYGDGELRIQRSRDAAKHAEIIEHIWGDRAEKKASVSIEKGVLVIPFREHAEQGVPVEWIEVIV